MDLVVSTIEQTFIWCRVPLMGADTQLALISRQWMAVFSNIVTFFIQGNYFVNEHIAKVLTTLHRQIICTSNSYHVTNFPWQKLYDSANAFVSSCTHHSSFRLNWSSLINHKFVDFNMDLQQGGTEFVPVRVGRSTLKAMNRNEVIIKRWPAPLKYQYYRSLMPDVSITLCESCNRVSRLFSWLCFYYYYYLLCSSQDPFTWERVPLCSRVE